MYEDIDAKDFAEKTGMSLQSISSMLKQARSNATLCEEMLAAGYTDGEFPAWWFSPAREAEPRQDSAQRTLEQAQLRQAPAQPRQTPAQRTLEQAQRTLTEAEVAEGAEDGRETQGEEGYVPTPPRSPPPKEGRPTIPSSAQLSDPALSVAQPASATFSDAELSLLQERGITEITPGRWMQTVEQASGRIMLTCAHDNDTIYLNSKARTTTE